jgi:serine protease AprX
VASAAKPLVTLAATLAALLFALPASGAAYDPSADPYSMASTASSLGADDWWAAGYTGEGVDVALIDSGVSPVQGLDAPGKVVYGPDLSLESQARSLANYDTFGHGTFMAGIIAGNAGSEYRGIAPDARIVSLKVATADGGTDVTQVIAAIDWVVQHAHDPGMNIRVLNLSYGTNSTQAYGVDPLAYAVEQAWKHGIVVVAAAGNAGYTKGAGSPCMADPAYDPFAIAVGGTDSMGTPSPKDDKVGSYSSTGAAGCKNPDVVAPGSHVQGLRVGNSYIDANHPEGRLGDRYFRGSGTSEAAAVVSGAAALVLQRYPSLTPDEVKRFFAANAYGLSATIGFQQGKGEIRLGQMLAKSPGSSTQKFAGSTGSGSIDASRGQDRISRDGVVLSGERDVFGEPVDTAALAQAEAAGSSWSGRGWNGSSWSGSSWSGSSWSGSSWSGSSWSNATWTGSSWSGSSWSGSSWSGSSWSGRTWATASWG